MPSPNDSVIVALDVFSLKEATALVKDLSPFVSTFKIGSVLFTQSGPSVIEMVKKYNSRVFLDLKFHDIPNTVAGACRAAAELGVHMLTIHACGETAMLEQAVEAVHRGSGPTPLLLGVTVLTSATTQQETHSVVLERAKKAGTAGLDGIVCSAHETRMIRDAFGKQLLIVNPGIRMDGGRSDDQARIATPREAFSNGSDYIVIGRPILQAKDPVAAIIKILDSL